MAPLTGSCDVGRALCAPGHSMMRRPFQLRRLTPAACARASVPVRVEARCFPCSRGTPGCGRRLKPSGARGGGPGSFRGRRLGFRVRPAGFLPPASGPRPRQGTDARCRIHSRSPSHAIRARRRNSWLSLPYRAISFAVGLCSSSSRTRRRHDSGPGYDRPRRLHSQRSGRRVGGFRGVSALSTPPALSSRACLSRLPTWAEPFP